MALATVGGASWLVREGDVILVGSRMHETWTMLPLLAGFVPFLDFLINRVAASESWIESAHPGEPVRLPVGTAATATTGGQVPVPADGQILAPLETGVYFLLDAVGDTVGALEVNHDARESRLEPASRDVVRAVVGEQAVVRTPDAFFREAFGGARQADLSGVLLLAAIFAALAELTLATAGSRSRVD